MQYLKQSVSLHEVILVRAGRSNKTKLKLWDQILQVWVRLIIRKNLLFEIVKATPWLQTPIYYNWEPYLLNPNSVRVGLIARPITDSGTPAMLQANTVWRYQAILTYAALLAFPCDRYRQHWCNMTKYMPFKFLAALTSVPSPHASLRLCV